MNYSYTKKIDLSFEETLDEVRICFIEKGFGVVSNINIADKIKNKVDSKFEEYTVLGFCNPQLAHKYLSFKKDLGVFLPCSVAIYKDNGDIYISAGLPDGMLPMIIDDHELGVLSKDITETMKTIIDSI